MMNKIRVANILNESLVNGEGIRTVVFFAGCDKACQGCHNLDLQDFSSGYDIYVDELVEKILKNKHMIDGVTLSGGDPLCQYSGCLELCKKLKNHGINIWLYTGETYEDIFLKYRHILYDVDTIIDGRYIESLKEEGLKFKGSSNQKTIYLDNGNISKIEF